ncbi:PREDICTED: ras-related protein Rab-11C-like [Amphimedon queenslandica]|uniref:Small monomeric GTPase n=2 Tax=Amphimedon queenslandica TaxID=400682 RepID=A0AAN0JUU8_AMPQE|nr:PREDICTED: ras-related protein Rab-11C-like [Amphimedon queenslandica]|eukprot:XP_019860649.1 PREDICTED: ras-related protein Rab-11C-like [Amphimedon queenslandica]
MAVRQRPTKPLDVCEIVVVGEEGVGRRSIISKYTNDDKVFNGSKLKRKTIELDSETIEIKISYEDIHDKNWQDLFGWGILLVYDVTNNKSFGSIKNLIDRLHRFATRSLLVGNKVDLESQREVPKEKGEQLAQERNISFLETSAITGSNINKAFEIIVRVSDLYLFYTVWSSIMKFFLQQWCMLMHFFRISRTSFLPALEPAPAVSEKSNEASEVFREKVFTLSSIIGSGTSSIFNRISDEFFSAGLISQSILDDINTVPNYCSYQRSSNLMHEVYKSLLNKETSNDDLIAVCDILTKQEDKQLVQIGEDMKKNAPHAV